MNADRSDSLRLPPQAIDAEQSVLGGLLISNRAWWDVCDVLTEQDFYRADHQQLWRCIADMAEQRKPFDLITMGDWLKSHGLEESTGGKDYVYDLATTTASAANIRAYAEIVADKAKLRRMIDVGTSLANDGFASKGRSAIELIGAAQTRIADLLASEPCDLEPIAPVMQRSYDRLAGRFSAGAGIHGLTTGLGELDHLLGGIKPGQLIVLAARPKMGKTTLAQNICEHVAIDLKKAVAVFSFEMQPEELGERMIASLGDIDAGRIRSGDLDDVDWANVTTAMQRIRGAQLTISRPKKARAEHVAAQVRRQHARTPLGLVVIDYLQLMHVSGDNRAQGIGDITRELKLMAGELGIPVLLLSQLNRDLEKRPDKRPVPADLRDSGSIEQDADAVVFIYRDEIYHPDSRYRGSAELIVALQRNGPSGDVRVQYAPNRFRFSDLPLGWEPIPMPKDEDSLKRVRGFKSSRFGSKLAAAGRE